MDLSPLSIYYQASICPLSNQQTITTTSAHIYHPWNMAIPLSGCAAICKYQGTSTSCCKQDKCTVVYKLKLCISGICFKPPYSVGFIYLSLCKYIPQCLSSYSFIEVLLSVRAVFSFGNVLTLHDLLLFHLSFKMNSLSSLKNSIVVWNKFDFQRSVIYGESNLRWLVATEQKWSQE